ncbi:MAG: hypothetical protein CMA40_00010 [Euryarchaeota archaeon]|nr:hypothetical protein [Euryarchaeota archaeon]
MSVPSPPSRASISWKDAAVEKSNESSPAPPVKLLTPVVPVKEEDVAAEPALSNKILLVDNAFASASKTLTLTPSKPSTIESETAPTAKVVEVPPEAIVAEPERTLISELAAAVTVDPFVSPIADQEKVVSAETAELAVIVNVTSPPSEIFEADLVTVNVGAADPLTPLFEIDTSELPAVLPLVGSVATPIPAANSASVLDVPETPEVALPPKS